MKHRFYTLDVFTDTPLAGNQLAVFPDAQSLPDDRLQAIAREFNLSETVFVYPPADSRNSARVRIFTPAVELPFAGHPTIGSAHAVIESGFATPRAVHLRQECRAGIIELEIESSAAGTKIFLQTPPAQISSLNSSQTRRLSAALGLADDLPSAPLRIDVGVAWLIADAGDQAAVARLMPRLDEVAALSVETHASGITVFGRAGAGAVKLHVRSFAPALGVAEDPVCGSGNAAVAAYLAHTGLLEEVGSDYLALQGMALGRAGEVAVRIGEDRRICVGGFAVTCVDGRLRVA